MQDVKGAGPPSPGPPGRAYVSARREESARQTRHAILAAAVDHFTADGYAATSLAGIARAAGVARPTVTAVFGSKAGLLKAALDEALAGDDAPAPVAERPWFRPVLDAPDRDSLCAAYAGVCTLIGSRAARLFEAARRAADVGEDTRRLWSTTVENRRRGAAMVVSRLGALEPARWPEGSPAAERATDVVWLFNDPAHYLALVHLRGWTEREYRDWLAAQLLLGLSTAAR